MRRLAWVFTVVAAVGLVSEAPAQASSRHHHSHGHRYVHGGGVGLAYMPGMRGVPHGHGTHFATLVGDPGGGLGFYALPESYRVGAYRYRMRNRPGPFDNPTRYAIAADAVRYNDWVVPASTEYRYGVFNPYDGVGTPFFAGYYGPADGYDEDNSAFPFGRPYK